LRVEGRDLAWAEYGGYRVENGRLAVLDNTGAVRVAEPLGEIDNITILLQVMREHAMNNAKNE
jgi:hypothetical protein